MGVQYIMVSTQTSRKLLVFFLVFNLCHSQDTINKTQTLQTDKTSSTGDLLSVINAAISDNAQVFNALNDTGLVVNLPSAVSLSKLSKSTWSLNSVNSETNATSNLLSVPGVAPFSLEHPETFTIDIKAITDNVTVSAINEEISAVNDQETDNVTNVSTEQSNQLTTENMQDASKTAAGLYIPMEKVARKKRQVINGSTAEQNDPNGRVLLPVNSRTPSDPVISLKSRNNIQEVLNSKPDVHESFVGIYPTLSEVMEGVPAIQRVPDLNNVELPLTTSSTGSASQETTGNSNFPLDIEFLTSEQVRGLLKMIPSVSNTSNLASNDSLHSVVHNTPDLHQSQDPRLVKITQGSLDNRNVHNTPTNHPQPRILPTIFRVSGNLARNSANRDGLSMMGQPQARPPVESRLAMQSSVSSQRITSPPQTSTTQRQGRPLVQAISRENLRQQIQGMRVIQPQVRRSDTQRSSRTQPATRRSRPTPLDPFTQRFSAGFLRGSNLLHQPPLQMRGFDRNNVGFNTLPPINNGLPPFLGPPPMFTGLGIPGIPNMFLGPSTL